jgi:diguanylate cyclase
MSNGKTRFSAIMSNGLLRHLPFAAWRKSLKKRGQAGQPSPESQAHERTRFRAIERIEKKSDASTDPVSTFISIMAINHFNVLRKQIGFQLANHLVAILAERMQGSAIGCEIGRIGRTSIEFAFAASSLPLAEEKLKALVVELEEEIEVEGYRFQLSVVIGAAEIDAHFVDEELVDRAEAAATEAQEKHSKVRITGLDDDTAGTKIGQLDMMRDLLWAMQNEGLELFYQPKLRVRTGEIDAVEALLRWTHTEHGPIPTDRMIAVAEASGAIHDLTRWVVERAIADQSSLIALDQNISVYINLSGTLVADSEFCRWAVARLADAKGKFGFEITETAVIDDPERALANLQLFSEAGVRIAIDDYGSGLSSLTYLKQLPANELKIDRSFINGLTSSHRDPLLVRSSIDLAHALEMDVTAEGVTDPVTLSLLRVMGCDLIQGYLISHPLPLNELREFLTKHKQARDEGHSSPSMIEWDISSAASAINR